MKENNINFNIKVICNKIAEKSTYNIELVENNDLSCLVVNGEYTNLAIDLINPDSIVLNEFCYKINSEIYFPKVLAKVDKEDPDLIEKLSDLTLKEIRKYFRKNFGFHKYDKGSFSYWFAHWSAFQMLSQDYKVWKWKYLLHDIEKPWMKLIFGSKYDHVKSFHKTHSCHHLDYGKINGWNKVDWVALVMDWECSRYTKVDAVLNARDTLEMQLKKDKWSCEDKKEIKSNVERVLDMLGM